MADSLNRQIDDLCRLADKIINNPSASPKDVVQDSSFNACNSVASSVVNFVFNPYKTFFVNYNKFDSKEGAINGLVTLGIPGGLLGYLKGKFNEKNAELQREREKTALYNRIIAKQQAVIDRLNDDTQKNKQEIANLKEMNAILSEVINK